MIKRSAIATAFMLGALLPITSASADDAGDVRGGFFQENTVSKGVFTSPSSKQTKTAPKEEAPQKDSFSVVETTSGEKTSAASKTSTYSSKRALKEEENRIKSRHQEALKAASEDEELKQVLETTREIRKRFAGKGIKPGNASSGNYYENALKEVDSMLQDKKLGEKKKTPTASEARERALLEQKAKEEKKRREYILNQSSKTLESASAGKKTHSPYRPKPVLSLIVSGKDSQHMGTHLEKLAWLKKHRNVQIGDVLIVGGFDKLVKTQAPRKKELSNKKLGRGRVLLGSYYKHLKNAGVPEQQMISAGKITKRLGIKNSPAWVVRHLGRDYIFEGFSNPVHLFNKYGEFVRSNNE